MEEAGKARRNYDEKYEPAKQREKHLHEAVCLIIIFLFTPYLQMGFLVQPTHRRIKLPQGSIEIIRDRSQRFQRNSQEVY
jgi:hypothetical protein